MLERFFRLLPCSIVFVTALHGAEPLRVLLLSGRNNHEWQKTTPSLEKTLTESGLFRVKIVPDPTALTAADFTAAEVIVSNFNTYPDPKQRIWSPETEAAFLAAIRQGRGFVVIHAGGSMLSEWSEFQDLIGGTWGPKTFHGAIHTFLVEPLPAGRDHPVFRGVPAFYTTDEFWNNLATRPAAHPLAGAFSDPIDPKYKGTGRHETVALVTTFGQGRCFNLVLGHNEAALSNVAVQTLIVRGTEWAATGKVSTPVPLERWPAVHPELAATLDAACRNDRAALEKATALVAAAGGDSLVRSRTAALVAARLASPDATPATRAFLCTLLAWVGTPAEVPALAPLLADPVVGTQARYALGAIPGEAATGALLSALDSASDVERIALIETLAARSDPRIIPVLVKRLAGEKDRMQIAALVGALGCQPSPDALTALWALRQAPADLALAEALFSAASAPGVTDKEALRTYTWLSEHSAVSTLGHTALQRALVLSAKKQQSALLAAALADKAPARQLAAIDALSGLDPALRSVALARLSALAPEAAAALIRQVALLGPTNARPALMPGLAPTAASVVRLAAVQALDRLGTASDVALLIDILEQNTTPELTVAARQALGKMSASGVNEALLAILNASASRPGQQVAVLDALTERRAPINETVLQCLGSDRGTAVRRAALRTLGECATLAQLPAVLNLVAGGTLPASPALSSALGALADRQGPAKIVALIDQRAAAATPAERISLIPLYRSALSPEALARLVALAQGPETDLARPAIRALATWPDDQPAPALAEVAAKTPEAALRAFALVSAGELLAKNVTLTPAQRLSTIHALLALDSGAGNVRRLLLGLALTPDKAALELVGQLAANPEVATEAAEATAALKKSLKL